MLLTLRPLDLEIDAAPYVELVNAVLLAPVNEERVREWARNFPPAGIRRQMVALADGKLVACNEATHRPNMLAGTFYIEAIVLPEFRRRGIGAQMYDDAVEFARAHGANRLTCEVRDHNAEWLQFAQKRGFEIDRHIFESTLDLKTFDETPFVGLIEAVQAQGICFRSLAEVRNTEENQRKLYEVNRLSGLDIPGYEGEFPSFEDFSRYVFQASWFDANGQIFAMDGERVVGLGAVGYFPQIKMAYNMHSGVLKEYRGRKIAQVLKVLTIRHARQCGADYIRTNNDSQNAPILAINRKLGYTPEPGLFRCVKVLSR